MIVFQYGSNCSSERLNSAERLNGDATVLGIGHTIENYCLAFDVWSGGNRCAASDIVPVPEEHKAWGVLYDVPDFLIAGDTAQPHHRKSFDEIEGQRYRRIEIAINQDGEVVQAQTYVVREPQAGLQTSVDYVRHIVLGLRERGVSEDYVREVKQLAAQNNPGIAADVANL